MWYKTAPYFSASELLAVSPGLSGAGDPPNAEPRPAWGAYAGITAVALLTMLVDEGLLNFAAGKVLSLATALMLALVCSAGGLWVYLQAFGPRFSLRIVLLVVTVLAAVLAIAFRH